MPRQEQGRFFWYDLMTPDVRAASEFYAEIAGWNTVTSEDGSYLVARAGEVPVAGFVQLGDEAAAHWVAQITTPDVAALCRRVAFLQGQVLLEPETMADIGTGAMIADTAGAVLHPFTPAGPLPEPPPPAPGHIGFHGLLAPRADLGSRVYKMLFEWKVGRTTPTSWGSCTPLKARTRVVAAALQVDGLDIAPQWAHHILVDDLDAHVATCTSLGARCLHEPTDVPKVGRIVTLADPWGAAFGLMAQSS